MSLVSIMGTVPKADNVVTPVVVLSNGERDPMDMLTITDDIAGELTEVLIVVLIGLCFLEPGGDAYSDRPVAGTGAGSDRLPPGE